MSINQKGSFSPIIVGVLVLLLAIGGGAYYLGMQRGNSQTFPVKSQSTTQGNVTASPATLPSETDNIKNWKIFSNTTQKYSLNYPPDWTVENSAADSQIYFRKVYPELGPHTDHSIYVTLKDLHGLSLKDWVTQNVVDPAVNDYKKQDIGNNITRETITEGDKTIEVITGAHLPAASDSLHLYFIADNKIVEMALWPYSGGQYETDFDKKGKEILYNMTSTFQSTN